MKENPLRPPQEKETMEFKPRQQDSKGPLRKPPHPPPPPTDEEQPYQDVYARRLEGGGSMIQFMMAAPRVKQALGKNAKENKEDATASSHHWDPDASEEEDHYDGRE